MIKSVSTVNIWTNDQEESLAFYTEKLGFEVRDDATLDEYPGFRWLTVGPPGQPDLSLVLMTIPTEPMFTPETQEQIRSLLSKGAAGGIFLATDDCRADAETLRGKGVELTEEPSERPYGIDAAFRDPSGNAIRLVQTFD